MGCEMRITLLALRFCVRCLARQVSKASISTAKFRLARPEVPLSAITIDLRRDYALNDRL
jgi:hypothetical protein